MSTPQNERFAYETDFDILDTFRRLTITFSCAITNDMDTLNNELTVADKDSSVVLKLEVDEDYNINYDIQGILRSIKVECDDEADVKSDIPTFEFKHIAEKEPENESKEQSVNRRPKQKLKNEDLSKNIKLEDEESEDECFRKKIKNINAYDLEEGDCDENIGDEDYKDNEGVGDVDGSNNQDGQESVFDENVTQEENFKESDESETEDILETRSIDSDTDHEFDEGDIMEVEEEEESNNFYSGRDGTKWRKTPWRVTQTSPYNILEKLPGVVSQTAKNAKNQTDCWRLFFDDRILTLIVENTNAHINSIKEKFMHTRNCRETDRIEIEAFLGLLYLAGVFRGGHQNLADFWSTDSLGIDIFRMSMSEKRFRFLIRCVRFDDRVTRPQRTATDKLAPVREIFGLFLENCKSHYHLGQNVTIAEMLPAFRGCCGFRQYIPSKPSKYGIKIFCLSDAKLFYTYNMEIYCGQQPEGPYRQSNSADSIVLRLSEPIFRTGRNITADKWFTSLKLIKELEKKKLSYVGTVRKNRREIPSSFVLPKHRNQYDSLFGYTKQETLVSYVPKKGKTVILLSSYHTSSSAVSTQTEKKPEIIQFYNETKSGVDVVDKLCTTYNTARSTRRWPMVIFYQMLNVAGVNSRIICFGNKMKYISTRDYLKKLALDLVTSQLQRRSVMKNLPNDLQVHLANYKPAPSANDEEEQAESGATSRTKRKYCGPCYKETKKQCKTQYTCGKCNKFLCLRLHSKRLCQECFEKIAEEDTD